MFPLHLIFLRLHSLLQYWSASLQSRNQLFAARTTIDYSTGPQDLKNVVSLPGDRDVSVPLCPRMRVLAIFALPFAVRARRTFRTGTLPLLAIHVVDWNSERGLCEVGEVGDLRLQNVHSHTPYNI